MSETEKVSRNAMYVLFVMAGLLAFEIGMFVTLLLSLDYTALKTSETGLIDFGLVVGVFTTAIATTGTLAATLIQQLWGK